MDKIRSFLVNYFSLYIVRFRFTDLLEILILAFLIYQFMVWVKRTRAFMLLRGILFLLAFIMVAYVLQMNTILWIAKNSVSVAITACVIVFQPELRKALESLGNRNVVSSILPFDGARDNQERFSDKTLNEIVKACIEMGKTKTGALIVIEQNILLTEYERTGIELDSVLSAQLLINIFEHNTPLHDGAVIVRGNRIVSATCYLPLSDNMELSKDLGTRHRAGIGISEVTDSVTVIVSEETGNISVAAGGNLMRNIDGDSLKARLALAQNKLMDEKRFKLWKGKVKNEKKADQ